MNLMNEYQEKFQDFRYQYISMRKVCDELYLHFGKCESDARAISK